MFTLKIKQKSPSGWFFPLTSEPLQGNASAALAVAKQSAAQFQGAIPTRLIVEPEGGATEQWPCDCKDGCAAAIYEAVKASLKGGAK